MARAKGRDVLLDLMDTVAALQKDSATLTDQFGLMREQVALLRDDLTGIRRALPSLELRVENLEAQFDLTIETQRRQEGHLARLARLLGVMADDTSRRFDDLEARVDALEH